MKIAVVGIGCHYPGAKSGKELFENILSGRRYFREMPAERWASDDYYHPDKKNPDTTYCKKAAVIEGFEFDPTHFKIPRSTYLATDQTQWLALKVAQEALQDANLSDLPNERTATIIGNTLTGEVSRATLVRYRWPYTKKVIGELLDNFNIKGALKEQLMTKVEARYKEPFPPINEDNLAGGLSNTIAGRIANFFDLKGGAFTTDGACSSSLLAINQSCMGLQRGDFDVAITGGVDISLDPFEIVGFAKVGALSDEDIRVYDQNSSGFLPGEGCGIVVLKRLDDAIASKDKIYAVINGVGISSDGKGGITAPSVDGQSLAVDRAYTSADYSFADVELIEGHGTGTTVGDNVELNTFRSAKLRHGANGDHYCGIGSIKSNLGHTKAAAGVAGFLKATLAVHYGFLPPTKGIRTPNNLFSETEHLYPLITAKPWPLDKTRRAAVSSAGFGGINTHITLSSVPESFTPSEDDLASLSPLVNSYQDSEVFFIGAENISDLKEKVSLLLTAAAKVSHAELIDLAQYCVHNFTAKNLRLGIVAANPEQLNTRLGIVLNYLGSVTGISEINYISTEQGIFIRTTGQAPRVTFLYPGQGSQYLNMGSMTKLRDPKTAECWDEMDGVLTDSLKQPLSDYVFADADCVSKKTSEKLKQQLNDTSIAQPAITATSIAMANYLKRLGINPDFSIGHSLGEYTALWSAGVLNTKQTLELVTARGDAMSKSADVPGAMLSIGASAKEVEKLIAEVVGYVIISNYNSPKQTVVSGEKSAIDSAYELCSHYGFSVVRLPVSSAFHSKLMDKAAAQMQEYLNHYEFNTPKHFVISSMTGKLLTPQKTVKQILVDQILQPVKFIDAINEAVEEDCHCFIEVGPGAVLSRLTERIIDSEHEKLKDSAAIFSTDIGIDGGQSYSFNAMLAYTYACGLPVKTKEVYKNRFYRAINLPYDPKFIASPCEFPIDALDLNLGDNIDLGSIQEAFGSPKTLTNNTVEPIEPVVMNGSSNGQQNPESVFQLLQGFIIKESGYSADMVNHEARLQADLGLDSLKSMEVVFEVMGQLGVRADAAKLGDVSLMEIAEYLYDLSTGNADDTASKDIAEFVQPDWVRAFMLSMSAKKLTGKAKALTKNGKVIIASLTSMPIIDELSHAIHQLGMNPEVIVSEKNVGENKQWLDKDIVGCIVIANNDCDTNLQNDNDTQSRLYDQPRLLLKAAKSLIDSKIKSKSKFFAYVTHKDGKFSSGENCASDSIDLMTGAGFVRTLHLENPTLQTRVIDFNPLMADADKAKLVLDEIRHGSKHVDAGYVEVTKREIPQFVLSPESHLKPPRKALKSGDTLLVTGGGKGITAECLLGLAKAIGIKVAIVGSSALPDADSVAAKESKNQELFSNLQRFKELGIDYRYYQCDVLDQSSVQKLFSDVKGDLGEIQGIIHAAGLNILHRLDSVEWSDFLQVLRPKMEGLLNIINAANLSELKLLSVFSSIIGHSGMMGNSDYSYANEWMSLVLQRLQTQYPDMQCQAHCFSVWSEVGMGAKLGSIDILGSIGVSAIPLKEGVEKFVEMSTHQWPATDMVITSRVNGLETIDFAAKKMPKRRFLEKIIYNQPGVELISEVFLDPSTDLYLTDHDYEGSLLFPAVMGIEAMVECSMACLGAYDKSNKRLPILENLSFDRAIIVPEEGRAIRIYVQIDEPDATSGKQVARVMVRSSVTNYEVDYFAADCVWQKSNREALSIDLPSTQPLSLSPMDDLYGKILFQGPMFQNIDYYRELSATHCMVRITVPDSYKVFSEESKYTSIYGSAEVRDTFLHAVQLCVPEHKILPVSMEEVTYQAYDTAYVTLNAIERERTSNEFIYDLAIYNDQGVCVETIKGFRCRIMGDYENEENLSTIYAAHKESALNNPKEALI